MITILQLSDIHLFSTKDQVYNDSNPYTNLKKVIDHLIKDKVNFDFLVLSGDLSNDFTTQSYDLLKSEVDRLQKKYYIIPGNHDDLRVMSVIFNIGNKKDSFDYSIKKDDWSFYFLDSTVPPSIHGEILDSQLEALKTFLANNSNLNIVIFMHHHPLDSESPHMNQYILKDKDAFMDIIKGFPCVKGVFFGHIHQVLEKKINNTLFASAPSTFYQIAPGLVDFKVEKTSPGYRLIYCDDKSLCSKVVWVE
jgi:Icc protein